MHSISSQGVTPPHVIPPDRLRAAVLGRRMKLPATTAALVAELCFGAIEREQADALPASTGSR